MINGYAIKMKMKNLQILQVTFLFHLTKYYKNRKHSLASKNGLKFTQLKGQCHEDFAVLDQFWAKIITLGLYSLTKYFCKVK